MKNSLHDIRKNLQAIQGLVDYTRLCAKKTIDMKLDDAELISNSAEKALENIVIFVNSVEVNSAD